MLQGSVIFPVHAQDKVEVAKVLTLDLSGLIGRDVITAFTSGYLCACVRMLANMKAMRGG